MDLITDGDVYRIEQSWEMGYDTAAHTMPLIRALRAARADVARLEHAVEGLHAGYNARTNSLASKVAEAEAEVIALRAEIGTIDGLLDYFGGLAELADAVKASVEVCHPCGMGYSCPEHDPRPAPAPIPVGRCVPDGPQARCAGQGVCAACLSAAAKP